MRYLSFAGVRGPPILFFSFSSFYILQFPLTSQTNSTFSQEPKVISEEENGYRVFIHIWPKILSKNIFQKKQIKFYLKSSASSLMVSSRKIFSRPRYMWVILLQLRDAKLKKKEERKGKGKKVELQAKEFPKKQNHPKNRKTQETFVLALFKANFLVFISR